MNSTTDHKMSADNPPQESQNLTGVKVADKLAPMTLPDDIELREELEIRLCINGCQQRTAGYNEAKQGKKGLDTDDMERMETIAVNEVMELIATYRKKWEAEARVDELMKIRLDSDTLKIKDWIVSRRTRLSKEKTSD